MKIYIRIFYCFLLFQVFDAGPLAAQNPVPHHLDGISICSSNLVALDLNGSVSNLFSLPALASGQFLQMFDLYLIDSSFDLSSWTRQAELLRTNNDPAPLSWQDPTGMAAIRKFYRTSTNYLPTAFPKPTGPYGVGKLDRILTDPSRTNRYGLSGSSSFMCTIWYPADPPSASSLPGAYLDAAVAKDSAFYLHFSWTSLWGPAVAAFVTFAYKDVPIASGTNRFPVVVHSHGYTVDRAFNSAVAIELASHGYIVAAVDHEDCHCTVFPDSRGVRYVAPGTVDPSAELGQSRVMDMEVLLGMLPQFDSSDPILAGRLDLNNIGGTGTSWGGGTIGELCRNDARVKCVAFLDPAIFAENGQELLVFGLQKPFLTMTDTIGTHSTVVPPPSTFWMISSNLFSLAATNATWFELTNTSHLMFGDTAWTMDLNTNSRNAAFAIDAATLWFFDTYLKGQTPAFPTNAVITNVQRK